jgi:hypothetical protein
MVYTAIVKQKVTPIDKKMIGALRRYNKTADNHHREIYVS